MSDVFHVKRRTRERAVMSVDAVKLKGMKKAKGNGA